MRSGCSAASPCAISPPTESPTTAVFSIAEVIEQRGEVGDMVGQRVGRRRRFRKPVAALVVAHDAEAAAELLGDRIPDAEIRAERIGENERRQSCAPLTS